MNILSLIVLTFLYGCSLAAHRPKGFADKEISLSSAEEALQNGEYYRARQIVRQVLSGNPRDPEAEKLMAQILDEEIATQKEIEAPDRDVMNGDERSVQAKVWLERGQSLLQIRQYDQALDAAENVFLYEPESHAASQLIDEIKRDAYREGKSESLYLKREVTDEIRQRIETYRREVQQRINRNEWGGARLAATKILLLLPEDKQALKWYDEIEANSRKAA